ncbi:MAG: outer membrane protein assembly factor BamB [Cocleimonas sp.]
MISVKVLVTVLKKVKTQTILTSVIVSSTFLLLSACSQQSIGSSQLFGNKTSRATKLEPLKKIGSPIPTRKVWEVKTGSAMGENKIHPYISGNTIFVAGSQSVSAWNKSSGKLIWKQNISETISAGVNGSFKGGDTQQITIGTIQGNVISLDSKTGIVRWIERLTSEVLAVSASKRGRIALRTVDGKLHGLSTQTGELIWQRSQRPPALTHLGASVPVIVGDNIISGFDNGKLVAYKLSNGQPQWEVTLALPRGLTELDKMIDIDGKINVLGNALFASSLNGNASGIQGDSGTPVWLKSFSTPSGLNATQNGVFSSDNQGNIWKLNPQTGDPIWKMDDLKQREPTLPTLINSKLAVVADKQGNIHWINTSTGKIVARNKGDTAGYSVEPEVDKKSIYFLGKSGVLTKLSQ